MSYKIEEIADNTFRLDENGRVNCYLVVGNEKALLIDGCWGIDDLVGTIRTITDKPIIAAATHRHPDHTCGLRQLGDYYVSEKDNILFNRMLENRFFGMAMVKKEKQKIQPYHKKKWGSHYLCMMEMFLILEIVTLKFRKSPVIQQARLCL